MAIQAIIMAGGEGVRLRPLTVNFPKPLVPLLGEPVMGYALKLLKQHGITDVGVTLCYQPQKIRAAFGKGEKYGVKLRYYEETSPLGTAGSVRMAKEHLKGTFLVLSGDGLTDCNLEQAIAFHKEKKALATLVLKRVSIPLSYGVVLTDKEGRVTRFIEKPTWSRVFSDLVNTGIYILEPEIFDYIPESGMQDFGKDIFPALLQSNLPLYGFETEGYWCDVGDQRAYLSAQQALLKGEAALLRPSDVHEEARVDPTATLEGHCQIGRQALIGPGAILKNAVIGEKCVIGAGTKIENACVWARAAVQEKAQLTGCVVCEGAVIRAGAIVADGCAIGQGASVGAGAELLPGVRIWPHLKAAPGAVLHQTLAAGDFSLPLWTQRGAECDTPENVCALCAAYGKVSGARQVILAHQGAAALQSLAAGALGAAGIRVLSAGEMTGPMLRSLVPALKMDGGIFCSGQTLRFLDENGAPLSPKQIAAMESSMLRQDGRPPFARPASIIRFSGAEEIYLARAIEEDGARPLWSPVAIFCNHGLIRKLAAEGLERMGARNVRLGGLEQMEVQPQETGFLISETGDEVTVFTQEKTLSHEQKTLWLLKSCLKKQGKIFDLTGVPRAAERLSVLWEADGSPECLRQRMLMEDGLAALFCLCGELKQGPAEMHLAGLPETHILMRDIACRTRDKGRILHTLCDQTQLPHTLGDGVRIRHEKGYATIVPDAYRGIVRVTGESMDSEFAQELCDFYLNQIQHMTGQEDSAAVYKP